MDGNGRWATKRLLPRNAGHKAGVNAIKRIAKHAFEIGVECMTVYVFSTENRKRPKEEVDGLINIIRTRLPALSEELYKNGVRTKIMGDDSFFPEDVQLIINQVREKCADGHRGIFNLALDYGSQAEIIAAANSAARDGEITKESFEQHLMTADLPPLDVIIRSGGERRLSNFMLYQAAYAELFFSDTLWPDFTNKEFDDIIVEFQKRNRRFGAVN